MNLRKDYGLPWLVHPVSLATLSASLWPPSMSTAHWLVNWASLTCTKKLVKTTIFTTKFLLSLMICRFFVFCFFRFSDTIFDWSSEALIDDWHYLLFKMRRRGNLKRDGGGGRWHALGGKPNFKLNLRDLLMQLSTLVSVVVALESGRAGLGYFKQAMQRRRRRRLRFQA